MSSWWDYENRVDRAIEVCRTYSAWCENCRVEISDRLQRDISYDSLLGALKRRKLGPPGSFCTGVSYDCDLAGLEDCYETSVSKTNVPTLCTENLLAIPDVHAPFEDKRAVDLVVDAAKRRGTDTIVQLGDLIDCYSVSSFVKHPTLIGMTLQDEIDSARRVLDKFDSIGAKNKIITLGNHSHRVEAYVAKNAPALYGMVDLAERLELKSRGWTWKDYGDYEVVGKVAYTHDLDNAGATAHMKARDEMGKSCVIGHTHRMGLSFDSTVCGSARVGAMFGTLADLNTAAKYMKRAKLRHWQLGFGTGLILPDGTTFLRPHPIVKYRFEVDGFVYGEAA